MKNLITTAAIFAATAIAAHADKITLDTPMHAASVHDGGVDMVVFFTEESDHYQLVATYTDADGPYNPSRIRMALQDGDETTFSMPGQMHVAYTFARDGESVSVSADLVGANVAAK